MNKWSLITDPPESYDLIERFRTKIHVDNQRGCWLWTAGCGDGGYGHFKLDGVTHNAHKYCFEQVREIVPPGLHLDHLCRIHHCVNPFHLEVVTPKENTLRGEGITAVNANKTHCINGHEFTPENTRFTKGKRHCRQCGRDRSMAYYHKYKG